MDFFTTTKKFFQLTEKKTYLAFLLYNKEEEMKLK